MAPEAERLAVLETKVAGIESRTERIESKIDNLVEKIDDNFVKHSEITALEKDINERLDGFSAKLTKLTDDKTNEKWIMRLLLAISVIVNIIGLYEKFN